MNINFSIINLNSLPILIDPGVEQLMKAKLLENKTLTVILTTNFRIYYIFLNAQITAYSKRFRTDDVTSNVQRK